MPFQTVRWTILSVEVVLARLKVPPAPVPLPSPQELPKVATSMGCDCLLKPSFRASIHQNKHRRLRSLRFIAQK